MEVKYKAEIEMLKRKQLVISTIFITLLTIYFYEYIRLIDFEGYSSKLYMVLQFIVLGITLVWSTIMFLTYIEPLLSFTRIKNAISRIREYINSNKLKCMGLFLLLIIGGGIRLVCVKWGYGYDFQADEIKLTGPAANMANTNSMYIESFYYPNQISAKIAAIFDMLYYRITGIGISEHPFEYVVIYRIVVAVEGMLVSFVGFLIGEKIKKNLGLILAALLALYPSFVLYSTQVTGDMGVALFTLLLILYSQYYMGKDTLPVWPMTFFAACATWEKWHGAGICIYIALVIIYKYRYSVKQILLIGIKTFIEYLLCLCLIVPNAVWQFPYPLSELYRIYSYGDETAALINKIPMYWNCFNSHNGIVTIIVMVVGLISIIYRKQKSFNILVVGVIYYIVFSIIMNRLFERWGLVIYFALLILIAEGIYCLFKINNKTMHICGIIIGALIMINYAVFDVHMIVSAWYSDDDTRILADNYFDSTDITMSNSVSTGYTPFQPGGWIRERDDVNCPTVPYTVMSEYFIFDEFGSLTKPDENIKYAVVTSFYDNYYTELENYCEIVYSLVGDNNDLFVMEGRSKWYKPEIVNIIDEVKATAKILSEKITGPTITVFDVSGLPVMDIE
jgi:hypothetical protein